MPAEPRAEMVERATSVHLEGCYCRPREHRVCPDHVAIALALDAAVRERDDVIAAKDEALRETLTNLAMSHQSAPLRERTRAALLLTPAGVAERAGRERAVIALALELDATMNTGGFSMTTLQKLRAAVADLVALTPTRESEGRA